MILGVSRAPEENYCRFWRNINNYRLLHWRSDNFSPGGHRQLVLQGWCAWGECYSDTFFSPKSKMGRFGTSLVKPLCWDCEEIKRILQVNGEWVERLGHLQHEAWICINGLRGSHVLDSENLFYLCIQKSNVCTHVCLFIACAENRRDR